MNDIGASSPYISVVFWLCIPLVTTFELRNLHCAPLGTTLAFEIRNLLYAPLGTSFVAPEFC
jgi:hypothetical protein